MLNPIMFADDTNLLFSSHDIKTLFQIVNPELMNIHESFKANKLSLNTGKTKYILFHKACKADYCPLKYPYLKLDNSIIKREYEFKFLGVIFYENLTWRKHIHIIENKISKNIGLLYKAKFLLYKLC